MSVLIIDNNDSFTYNLKHLIRESGEKEVKVVAYGDMDEQFLKEYRQIVISPGPGLPGDYPKYSRWFALMEREHKLFGICMGHEILASVYGGQLMQMRRIQHGIIKNIRIDKKDELFKGIAQNPSVGLYHSWVVDEGSLPQQLEVIARDEDHKIMALKHRQFSFYGVQFHPESYMTTEGIRLMTNWLLI